MAGKIKVSSTGKLFFSRVVKNGRVQRAFRDQIGIPVGNCVAGRIEKGTHPGRTAVRAAIDACAREVWGRKGTRKLALNRGIAFESGER